MGGFDFIEFGPLLRGFCEKSVGLLLSSWCLCFFVIWEEEFVFDGEAVALLEKECVLN